MSKTPELMPCPFTGEMPVLEVSLATIWVASLRTELYSITIVSTDKADAIKKVIECWNTRVYPAAVQKAIERDTPKKPIILRGTVEIEFKCPSCREIADWFTQDNPAPNVCHECGQRLDWSEE